MWKACMDALLVIDMQRELLDGGPKLDLEGVVDRINRLSVAVRSRYGKVIWVQHSGRPGENTASGAPGWNFLPQLNRQDSDTTVAKTLNDPFAGTNLNLVLRQAGVTRLLVCGWATDFCVDSGVRSAVSNGFDVIAVSDAHTVSDRPHIDAASVIRHFHYLWENLIASRSIAVMDTRAIIDNMGTLSPTA